MVRYLSHPIQGQELHRLLFSVFCLVMSFCIVVHCSKELLSWSLGTALIRGYKHENLEGSLTTWLGSSSRRFTPVPMTSPGIPLTKFMDPGMSSLLESRHQIQPQGSWFPRYQSCHYCTRGSACLGGHHLACQIRAEKDLVSLLSPTLASPCS